VRRLSADDIDVVAKGADEEELRQDAVVKMKAEFEKLNEKKISQPE
jgi:hypothetical protein